MDFNHLSPAERSHMEQILQEKQMKDFMRLYSSLVQRCFNDCIKDFTTKALTTKEDTCVGRCIDKFLKHNDRIGQRFAEQNAAMMSQQQQQQQPPSPFQTNM
ncbi:protein transporter tim9 [Basidiobolus ranarum]|uniref:Mitochondrial import inner membrane translocase subunit n=1 Tax=Basidiobolus ranarum TaxID=34480 RepID=A0ABR2VPH4_9FUNG